ncbi:MAG: hypothetical protein NTX25_10020, partial [Proteobacteria bacterium]|nr:hypothetical protein [Pseudomonadota bacterium]
DNNVYLATPALGRPAAGGALTTASCNPTGNNALLGFSIDPCVAGGPTPRYSYSTAGISPTGFTGSANSGAGAANSVCPGNAAHVFTVDQANSIVLVGGVALPNPCIN